MFDIFILAILTLLENKSLFPILPEKGYQIETLYKIHMALRSIHNYCLQSRMSMLHRLPARKNISCRCFRSISILLPRLFPDFHELPLQLILPVIHHFRPR